MKKLMIDLETRSDADISKTGVYRYADSPYFDILLFACSVDDGEVQVYSGDTKKNIENARKYCRFAVDKHYLPIAPHLLFTQFMDDTIPEERETAIFMNFVLMSKCVEMWVFGDVISKGIQSEINRAKRKNMKIRYFTEELEEK